MPTYDYLCPHCQHRFELFESMNARGTRVCPRCERKGARRGISVTSNVIYKGAGFYITEYKNGGKKPKKANGKPQASKEAKPATSTNDESGTGNKTKG